MGFYTRSILISMLLLLSICGASAQIRMSGRVLDAETGETLIGATLSTRRGGTTLSNGAGRYLISVPKDDTLRVSYVGYETLYIPSRLLKAEMDLQLKPTTLGEVTVTASIASARSRRAIGSDVVRLDVSKLIQGGQGSSITDVLDGRISGVQLYQSNGKVGMPIRFNMRSGATLSIDRDPVIYVDGVKYNSSHTSDINSAQDAMSALSDLNLDDVATIDVIKGPAAAASYGAEAANGVIVITTKRHGTLGVNGRSKVNANIKYSYGISQMARKYDQFVNNNALNKFFIQGRQHSIYANLSKTFATGNGIYLSANLNDITGIVPGNSDKRHSIRAAYDMRQGSLSLALSASYTHGDMSIPQTAQGRHDAIWNLMRTIEPWQYVSERTWRAQSWRYANDRLVASAKVSYRLPLDIKLETQLGIDINYIKGVYRLPYGYLLSTNDQGHKTITDRRNANINWDWKLSRQFDLGNGWKATGTLLSQMVRRDETMEKLDASIFTADVDNVSAASKQQTSETNFEQRTWGVYGEAFINYDNRLFINAGLRRDASNLIGANVTSIYYPSLSVSYNWDKLKLRTAYGESGRLPYPTDARTAYTLKGMSAYGPTVTPSTKGNPNIRPERMRELELGLDYRTRRHELSLTAYGQFTSDAIIYVPLLASDGWQGTEPQNLGRVRGFGAEVSWRWKAFENQSANTSLDIFTTLSWQTNKVTDTGGTDIENLPNTLRVGLPAYAFYYSRVEGASYDKAGKYNGAKESKEYHLLGKPFPDFNGAFGFDFRFLRDFTLSTKFAYALGASVYNQSFYNVAGLGDNYKRREELLARLSTHMIGTKQYEQVAEELARTERKRANFIEPADFLRLSTLSLSYDASKYLRTLTRSAVKGGRIVLSASNVILITNYSGIEPQVESNGGTRQQRGIGSLSRDITNTPTPRTYMLTLSLDF